MNESKSENNGRYRENGEKAGKGKQESREITQPNKNKQEGTTILLKLLHCSASSGLNIDFTS